MTRLLSAHNESAPAIGEAVAIIHDGGLVAFPTETVYGLGADALRDDAVERIYRAKGRPATNPLIVHCASREDASHWAEGWNESAERLAVAFWPGPLTMILKAGTGISRAALAGGDTVGLRVPAHPVALALIRQAGVPLAAPSANASSTISPTSAALVLKSLQGRIDAVLDGGTCPVGIESTVLDLTTRPPTVLRPGMISATEIAEVLGKEVSYGLAQSGGPMRSPGMLTRHYAPRIPLKVLKEIPDDLAEAYIIRRGNAFCENERGMVLPDSPREVAARLYWALHLGEESGAKEIWIEAPPTSEPWRAIHDRLRRASAERG